MVLFTLHDKTIYMFLQISCYPCGAVLLRTKAICSKCMHRLVSISVDYVIGERYFMSGFTEMLSAFPCGKHAHAH